jgi:RNA polymerase sigma-70 factor, ECF subfamily
MQKNPWFDSHISFTTGSFESVYRKFTLPLMKFIVKRMGGRQEDAEEVFERTISAAWEGYRSFEHKSSFFTWVCRIALNKMADYYREQIHEESILIAPTLEEIAEIGSKELSPTEKLALAELRASIRACLYLLPKEKREIIYLRYWEKWSIAKIAKYTGYSERAAEGQLYRAKQSLKNLIEINDPEFVHEYRKEKQLFR